jgi:hypothetical protein
LFSSLHLSISSSVFLVSLTSRIYYHPGLLAVFHSMSFCSHTKLSYYIMVVFI